MQISSLARLQSEKQSFLKETKEALINGTLSPNEHTNSPLVNEWKTSLSYGIDSHMSTMDNCHLNPNTLSNISTYLKAYNTYYADFFDLQNRALSKHGCAVFYLDNELSVFNKYGDTKLLEKFKEFGIKFSTCFSLSNMGVNVANLAVNNIGTIVRRYGQENYLDFFTDFVCYAKTVTRNGFTSNNTILMVAPINQFHPYIEELILYLFEIEELLSSKVQSDMEDDRMKLLKKASVMGEDEMLVCNADGNVIFINENLEVICGLNEALCRNRPLSDLFPSLTFCLRSLTSKQNIPLHETYICDQNGESYSYYAECLVIKNGNEVEGLKIILKKTSKIQNYVTEVAKQTTAQYSFGDMKGNSKAFQKVISVAQKAANNQSNVLIVGESGTGKELMAHSIHSASNRRTKPFVPLNCGAIPKDLIASELFGYDEGAFTGAKKGGYIGKLEQANGGTLFLDEIGEMPYDMQATLLRFLEDGVIYRLGGKKPIPLNVRIISATNKNLPDYIEAGKFRLDLYYRLNVIKLTMPPLRERAGDIPLLINALLTNLNRTHGTPIVSLTPDVVQLFENYTWPGNLRELRNTLEYVASTADYSIVDVHHLPEDVLHTLQSSTLPRIKTPPKELIHPVYRTPPIYTQPPSTPPYDNYDEYEQQRILELMIKYNGNKSLVAKELGIARSTLYRKLKNN